MTAEQKQTAPMTGPADLSAEEATRLQHVCKRAYRALDLSGYARLDLRIDATGRAYVLEANPKVEEARNQVAVAE